MAQSHDARLAELVAELGGDEVRFLFRDLVEKALQELMDAELTEAIGAEPHERTESRTNRRSGLGHRMRDVLLRESTMRERPNRRLRFMWWLPLLAVLAVVACETADVQETAAVDDPAISTLNQSDRTEVTNSVPGESTGEGEEPPDDTDPTGGDSRSPVAEADVTPSEVFNVEILAQRIAGVDWFLYRYVDDGSDSFWTMSVVDGQVDFDPESGCVYRALDGDRDPAVWPRGTTISPTGDSLVLRSGEVLEDGAGFEGGGGGLPVPTLIERCPADSRSDVVGIGIIDPTGS